MKSIPDINPNRPRQFILLVGIMFLLVANAGSEAVRYSLVSKEAVISRLKQYKGDNKEREATLMQLFNASGCGANLAEQKVKGSSLPNVICTLPGSSKRSIIVGAHFDHAPEGEGVVDNWSGASLLPSLYEAIKAQPRQHTYIFIGFTDEEEGEIGSHFYAKHMTKEQIATTDAMVCMDTLGLAPTEIWASHSDQHLTREIVYIAKLLSLPVSGVNVEQVGSTDSEQFPRKIPRITLHSLTQETWNAGILHSAKDNFSAVKLEDYYDSYHLIAAYIAYLDELDRLPAAPPGRIH